jgi:hypothetical protein
VIFFGDSVLSFVGGRDVGRRRLDTMVSQSLGSEVKVHVVDGPSFNPDLYDAYLRLLAGTPHRPLVIVPLCIRVRTPTLMEHPVHGHKRALQALRETDPTGPLWQVRGSWPRPTQSEFDEFHRVPYSTLLGDLTIGDYLKSMAACATSGDEKARIRLLYNYHHGGVLEPDSPGMEAIPRMARTIAELGCPAVAYHSPVPVQTGVTLLGRELADRTEASFAAMGAGYRAGAGPDAMVIECDRPRRRH